MTTANILSGRLNESCERTSVGIIWLNGKVLDQSTTLGLSATTSPMHQILSRSTKGTHRSFSSIQHLFLFATLTIYGRVISTPLAHRRGRFTVARQVAILFC